MRKVTSVDMLARLQEVLNQSIFRHDGASCTCFHGSSRFEVIEAYQNKNPHLWRRYGRFVRSIRDKHNQHKISPDSIRPSVSEALTDFAQSIDVDLAGNERLLFHGTPEFAVAKTIATEGFDNRTARDSGIFGKGTYFAAQTCKSAQYAAKEGWKTKATAQMPGTMLIARVAIGDPYYATGPCKEWSRA